MTIPYLSGNIDPRIMQSLQENTKGIADFLNPDAALQKSFKQYITQNPEKLQDYVDLARTNPTAFANLRLGKIGDALTSGGTLSTKAQVDQTVKTAIQDPKAMAQIISRETGIKTPEENAKIQSDADLEKIRLANETGAGKLQGLQIQEAQGTLDAKAKSKGYSDVASSFIKGLPKAVTNLYVLDKNKGLSPDIKTAIFANTDTRDRYDKDAQTYFDEQRNSMERDRLSGRMERDNFIRNTMFSHAEQLAMKTGNPDVQSFFELQKPGQMNAMAAIDSQIRSGNANASTLQANAPAVYQQYQAFKSLQSMQEKQVQVDKAKGLGAERGAANDINSQFGKVSVAISKLINGTGTPEEIQQNIDNYNMTVGRVAVQDGLDAPTLQYDPNNHRAVFIKNGKPVDATQPQITRIAGFGQTVMSDEDKVGAAVNDLMSSTNAAGDLAKIKLQLKSNPTLYQAIVAKYNQRQMRVK